jgi:hypothetical protein
MKERHRRSCWLLITPATSCHGRSAGSACLPPNASGTSLLDIGIAGLGRLQD